ncbi:hypothetical protein HBI14_177820 [Parastagonospora nodorum]|nr:hypothetical protein HBI14_177820 [Parastagonospora nodorum]
MSQTNVREGYRITTLEVVELIEDLITKYTQLRNAQIPKVFYKAAYSAKVKIENLSNTLMLILSKTAQRRSSSVVSNRSTALITNKFSVVSLTKPAILNNANIALVDAIHHSVVIDALMITLIKNDNDLLGTINSHIKLRKLRARCKTKAADSRYVKLGKKAQLKKTRDKEELAKLDSLLDSDNYCLDSSLDINSKDDLEDEEATTAKDLLTDAYILYFKELLSDNSRIFANAISIGKTQAIVLAVLIEHLYSTKGERTFYCACKRSLSFNAEPQQAAIIITTLQFCFFSNSPLENIGRLTKEEAIKMQINTTNAISKALAAANKLVTLQSYIILEANTPAVHSKATKHCLALLAAQFVIVCSFRKIDKHMFRAYNTISVTAQRTIIRKGGSYVEKRAILLSNILEKEGLNKLEASRRVIFNCFKMQAIFKTYSSCKVKRFTLNSVKDLFTNLSKDYFLIIVALIAFAEAITLTEATHVLAEICVSIVYFNLDSKLELKVLGKQDVKITS